jgi:hypothetical protein
LRRPIETTAVTGRPNSARGICSLARLYTERERACHRCATGVNKQLKCPAMFQFLRGF